MEKKTTKKKIVKKTPSKKVTKKKETIKKEEVKEEPIKKEEPMKNKGKIKDLVFSLLYFACSVTWVIIGVNKAVVKEKFIFDIIVSIVLFVIATIYFMSYKKSRK